MSGLLRRAERLWPWATLGLLAVVTALSLWPEPGLQDAAPGGDKLQHLIAYGAVALPMALARPRGWAWWLAGVLAWSGGIELVQPLVGRTAHPADLAANAAGLALGAVLGAALRRRAARRGLWRGAP